MWLNGPSNSSSRPRSSTSIQIRRLYRQAVQGFKLLNLPVPTGRTGHLVVSGTSLFGRHRAIFMEMVVHAFLKTVRRARKRPDVGFRLKGLPDEVLGLVLSFSTRWSGVNCTQLVCKAWRSRVRSCSVHLGRLAVVTLPGPNLILILGQDGDVRAKLPAVPWRPSDRVSPWGEADCGDATTRDELTRSLFSRDRSRAALETGKGELFEDRKFQKSSQDPWPTAVLCTPKHMYCTQYSVSGVLAYKVQETGHLSFERTYSHRSLERPEGLAIVHSRDILYVLTANGSVHSVNAKTGHLLQSLAVFPWANVIAWNLVSRASTLYVAAHRPLQRPYQILGLVVPARPASEIIAKIPVDEHAPEMIGTPALFEASGSPVTSWIAAFSTSFSLPSPAQSTT